MNPSPAPWRLSRLGFGFHVEASNGAQVAVAYGEKTNPNYAADTYLIAAAPDLLATLKRVAELCDAEGNGAHFLTTNDTTRALCRAAIAKAEARAA